MRKKKAIHMVKGTALTPADEKLINDSVSSLWHLSVNSAIRKMEYRMQGKYAMAELLAEAELDFANLSRRLNSMKDRLLTQKPQEEK